MHTPHTRPSDRPLTDRPTIFAGPKDSDILLCIMDIIGKLFISIGADRVGGVWKTSDVGTATVVASGALDAAVRAAAPVVTSPSVASHELVACATRLVENVCMFRAGPRSRKALLRAYPSIKALLKILCKDSGLNGSMTKVCATC
jgi:hypothetical protein